MNTILSRAALLIFLLFGLAPAFAQEVIVPVEPSAPMAGVTLRVDGASLRFVAPGVADADAPTYLEATASWTSQCKAIVVHVVQKPTEDVPSFKVRVRAAVAAMEDLFPPDKKPPVTGR